MKEEGREEVEGMREERREEERKKRKGIRE